MTTEPQWIKDPSRAEATLHIHVSDAMQHSMPPRQLMAAAGREIVESIVRQFLKDHQDEILAQLDVATIAEAVEANVKATLALRMLGGK